MTTIRTLHKSTERNPLFAYLDTFSGLVPVKILRYYVDDWSKKEECELLVTATRPGYKKGTITSSTLRHVVSRKTFTRGYNTFIHTTDHDAARQALNS